MHRARDRVDNADHLDSLETAADRLDLDGEARRVAADLFLSAVPEAERSKPPAVAASLYAGALVAGDRRSQAAVAEAVGVSRPALGSRWKEVLERSGLEPPTW